MSNAAFESAPRVAVLGVGAFFGDTPSGEAIEKRSRRRSSTLTRALADAFAEAIADADVDPSVVPAVFGSALGEADTMIGLLDGMFREGGALSPMKFAMSVHNAAAGVVSISANNRGFATSLGADFDTPAMALLEGIGLVRDRDEAVVVVCGDDGVPLDIIPEHEAWPLLTAAIVIGPQRLAPDAPTIAGPVLAESSNDVAPTPPWDGEPSGAGRNPSVGLLDLVRAVRQLASAPESAGGPTVVRVDRGPGRGWCFELARP